MVIAARSQDFRSAGTSPPSRTFLAQLGSAHDALLHEMANLDQATLGPMPDYSQLAAIRWRLSQASLRRRSLTSRIIEYLGSRMDGDDRDQLNAFQEADRRMMQRSARHVGSWTVQTITRDWKGYCEASREIRMHMDAHVQLERQLLCPMLERLAGRTF